jgi:hypothetical protein
MAQDIINDLVAEGLIEVDDPCTNACEHEGHNQGLHRILTDNETVVRLIRERLKKKGWYENPFPGRDYGMYEARYTDGTPYVDRNRYGTR